MFVYSRNYSYIRGFRIIFKEFIFVFFLILRIFFIFMDFAPLVPKKKRPCTWQLCSYKKVRIYSKLNSDPVVLFFFLDFFSWLINLFIFLSKINELRRIFDKRREFLTYRSIKIVVLNRWNFFKFFSDLGL